MSNIIADTFREIRRYMKDGGVTLSQDDVKFIYEKLQRLYSKAHAEGYQECSDEDQKEYEGFD